MAETKTLDETKPRQAGDYLGTLCAACKAGEYGLPSFRADATEAEALRELGPNAERDPADGSWVVLGSVCCPLCGDARARFLGEAEVQVLREGNRERYVEGQAEGYLARIREIKAPTSAEAESATRDILVEALEESWGPLQEVIDYVVVLDEEHGTPLWGHPYWTAQATKLLGIVASRTTDLPHPGNEFVTQRRNLVRPQAEGHDLEDFQEVELEPPVKGSEKLRPRIIHLTALLVRWIAAIDERVKRESKAEEELARTDEIILANVQRLFDMQQGRFTAGDEEEERSVTIAGTRGLLLFSLSPKEEYQESLRSIGVTPLTEEQCEAAATWLDQELKPKLVEGEAASEQSVDPVPQLELEIQDLKNVVEDLKRRLGEALQREEEAKLVERETVVLPEPAPEKGSKGGAKKGTRRKRAKARKRTKVARKVDADVKPEVKSKGAGMGSVTKSEQSSDPPA